MGDNEFTRLYSEHAASLYAFLSYRTGDRVLAEDLLADTFERVLRARRGYDRHRASERTWLFAIALNCLRDTARRAGAETRALARAGAGARVDAAPDQVDGLLTRETLHEALARLSDAEREAVALRYAADLSLEEIAAATDEPRSKIESRIYRGLQKLRDGLGSSV